MRSVMMANHITLIDYLRTYPHERRTAADPPEPECLDGASHHWITTCVEGTGAGVRCCEFCRHCSALRIVESADGPNEDQETIAYLDPSEVPDVMDDRVPEIYRLPVGRFYPRDCEPDTLDGQDSYRIPGVVLHANWGDRYHMDCDINDSHEHIVDLYIDEIHHDDEPLPDILELAVAHLVWSDDREQYVLFESEARKIDVADQMS